MNLTLDDLNDRYKETASKQELLTSLSLLENELRRRTR